MSAEASLPLMNPPAAGLVSNAVRDERFTLLDGGTEAYPRMLEAIASAQVRVHLEVYTFEREGILENNFGSMDITRLNLAFCVMNPKLGVKPHAAQTQRERMPHASLVRIFDENLWVSLLRL